MREADPSFSETDDDCDGSCIVFSPGGPVGIEDCSWLRELLQLQEERGAARLVVDLSRVSSMDWWVALLLVRSARVIRRRGGTLVLTSPQPAVARLLRSTAARRAPESSVSG